MSLLFTFYSNKLSIQLYILFNAMKLSIVFCSSLMHATNLNCSDFCVFTPLLYLYSGFLHPLQTNWTSLSSQTFSVSSLVKSAWAEIWQCACQFFPKIWPQCWRNTSCSMKYLEAFICSAMVKRATGPYDAMPSPRRMLGLATIRLYCHVTCPLGLLNSKEKTDTSSLLLYLLIP